MPSTTSQKHRAVSDLLADLGRVVVAYSGGVDSAFLAAVAHNVLGNDSLAVTAASPSIARSELSRARELAVERGWNHTTIETHEVGREEYSRNDPDRCYWCKTELFETLGPLAGELGAAIVVGTNVDDLGDHRPGLRAADENGVLAPLVIAGLSKSEIRMLSEDLGLPTATKPASPCLASRFAYGIRVTPEGLRRVDRAEEFIASLGFQVFRVRDHGELARVEVPQDDIARAAELAAQITEGLKALGYSFISLDLQGFRSGAMNEVIPGPRIGRG